MRHAGTLLGMVLARSLRAEPCSRTVARLFSLNRRPRPAGAVGVLHRRSPKRRLLWTCRRSTVTDSMIFAGTRYRLGRRFVPQTSSRSLG
jgi:hypothetical protein